MLLQAEIKISNTDDISEPAFYQLSSRSLIDCLFELVTSLRDTVRDAVGHTLLPDVVIVDQGPVPENERRSGPIAVYFNL